ncbi:MAG: response regulator [Bryobacteraceae bacterium]|nr:response regulator [Bryobacteraceae bacterium]
MAPRSATPNNASSRILLVDDNENGLKARRAVLEELGYHLTCSNDPAQALDIFRTEKFDLLVTDYRMPGMDGTEVIKGAKQVNPEIPVILLSGFVDALGMTEENTGADAVIQKSNSEVQHLLRAVGRLLRKKKPAASIAKKNVKSARQAG